MTTKAEQKMMEQWAWLEAQQIHVSGRIAQEVYPKANPQLFADVLRRNIDLSKYGNGIEKFFFTFVILEDTVLEFEGEHYNSKKRVAEIAVRTSLNEVINADQATTMRLMEATYLRGIDKIENLNLAASFDHATFKQDVEAIFADENWYKNDLAKYKKAQP